MSKRADGKFERNPRDFYITPPEAVEPLIAHLPPGATFDEPCAGNGSMVNALEHHGMICTGASDLEPQCDGIEQFDAFDIEQTDARYFISNTPWDRKILHPLIVHLSDIAPTWLLFDADWMHTVQAKQYLKRCSDIVSVGRVSWMGNGVSGFDNCSWYLFDSSENYTSQNFYGRQ